MDNHVQAAEQGSAENVRPLALPTTRPLDLSLTRNFVWTLGGNVIYTGCQWAVVVLLAKLSSVEIVGEYALAVAVAVPLAFLGDFRLRILFVTDTADKYPFREMLGLRFILSCLSLVVIMATCGIVGYGRSTALITLMLGSAYIVDSISDTYYGRFQRNERMDRIATSLILRSVLSAIAFTVALYFTHKLLLGVCSLTFARGSILFLYDARVGAQHLNVATRSSPLRPTCIDGFRPSWNVRRQLQMLWVAFPLAIVSVLISINGYVPRYLLELFVGRREVGIYSAINYIPSGCFLVVNALGYAVFARLSKLFASGDLGGFKFLLAKIAAVYGAIGAGGSLLSFVAGRQVLTFIYRPEYAQRVDLLRWLMMVGVVNCLTTAMQSGLTAASRFRVQVPLFAGVTAISLLGSAILIPRMGLVGAALAALISSVVQLCASSALVFSTMVKRARELRNTDYPQFKPVLEVPQ
jgi:O-antigen/teichoic acid export membrane protein